MSIFLVRLGSEKKRFLSAFFMVCAAYLFQYCLFGIAYGTNDDFGIVCMNAGLGSSYPSMHNFFSGLGYNFYLYHLFQAFPYVDWHSFTLLGVNIFSFSTFFYGILRFSDFPRPFLLFFLFVILVMPWTIGYLQFTETSIYAGFAAVFWAILGAKLPYSPFYSKLCYIFSLISVFISAQIRLESTLLVGLSSLPITLPLLLRFSKKEWGGYILPLLIILLGTALSNHIAFNKYQAFNKERGQITDNPIWERLDTATLKAALRKVNYSENDFHLVKNFFLEDPSLYNKNQFNILNTHIPNIQSVFKEKWKDFLLFLTEKPMMYMKICAILAWYILFSIVFHRKLSFQLYNILLISGSLFILFLVMAIWIKLPPRRIYTPITFTLTLLSFLPLSKKESYKSLSLPPLFLHILKPPVLIVILGIFFIGNMYIGKRIYFEAKIAPVSEYLPLIKRYQSHHFFYIDPNLILAHPFSPLSQWYDIKARTYIGAIGNLPETYKGMESYFGRRIPFDSLCCRKDVIFMTDYLEDSTKNIFYLSENLNLYMQEHHQTKLSFELLEKKSAFYMLRPHCSPTLP